MSPPPPRSRLSRPQSRGGSSSCVRGATPQSPGSRSWTSAPSPPPQSQRFGRRWCPTLQPRGPRRPRDCGLGPPPGPGSANPPGTPARFPRAPRASVQPQPPPTPAGPQPPAAPPAAARVPRWPASYLAGPPAASERAPSPPPRRPRGGQERGAGGPGAREPQPERRRPAVSARAVTLACAASRRPASVSPDRGVGAGEPVPPRPPTSPEPGPVEGAQVGGAAAGTGRGAGFAQPGRGGGALWPRPFAQTPQDPRDKHLVDAAAGRSLAPPKENCSPRPPCPAPSPKPPQFSDETTKAQRGADIGPESHSVAGWGAPGAGALCPLQDARSRQFGEEGAGLPAAPLTPQQTD